MRRTTWPEDLAAYLDTCRDRPFAWATHDCCAFAAGAVEAITGQRPALPVYGDEREALRLLRERSLRDRVGDLFGPEITPAFAARGDLALLMIGDREALGVCTGDHIAGIDVAGLVLAPRSAATAAWSV